MEKEDGWMDGEVSVGKEEEEVTRKKKREKKEKEGSKRKKEKKKPFEKKGEASKRKKEKVLARTMFFELHSCPQVVRALHCVKKF
ncbi:hypothetical protein QVD17_19057 [Tagetes erecta]|uniref:Uncharacterized protein n=1 Tax=Tagetes erecta TaxID=13708 RepID=A0AAD8KIU5_TARER|nr:hypothetical protein QVD17_19057 [Tagetes erecta]